MCRNILAMAAFAMLAASLCCCGTETLAQHEFLDGTYLDEDGTRTICPEKLVCARHHLTFPNGEHDSVLVMGLLDEYVRESRFAPEVDTSLYYENVFLETDRPWDWLDFVRDALDVTTSDNTTFSVKVRWERIDVAFATLVGKK